MLSDLLSIYPELKFDTFLYSTNGLYSSKIIFNNFNLKIFTEMYADGAINYESGLGTSKINDRRA